VNPFIATGMRVVLISTYELGRQPFGLASPAAWLHKRGFQVECLDLSREAFRDEAIRAADFIAFYVPMHTATRLAIELIEPVRKLNPRAKLCFYGLYAPINETFLQKLGVEIILGGEFEERLLFHVEQLARAGKNGTASATPLSAETSLARLTFEVPDRAGLVRLKKYAHVILPNGEHRVTGYTEASRGCKHLCRHCPIVPVYNGAFRVVQREVVLADIGQQVAAGAEHITFGDPDFFNGPSHALAIVEALHREFPAVSYDVTIKIEHLLKHRADIRTLRETGCLFVTSAVESVDDAVLERLDKGHTRADFLATIDLFRKERLTLQPTFVPFTPWTTLESYADLLNVIARQGLIGSVPPIQLGIRLLIPAGSRMLELSEIGAMLGGFDEKALAYPWRNPDPRVDVLCDDVQLIVHRSEKSGRSRAETFRKIWSAAQEANGESVRATLPEAVMVSRAAVPYLNEPWYC
jgi:radical SAM superfamily enzyme YgiQ (UPF0313 family)